MLIAVAIMFDFGSQWCILLLFWLIKFTYVDRTLNFECFPHTKCSGMVGSVYCMICASLVTSKLLHTQFMCLFIYYRIKRYFYSFA